MKDEAAVEAIAGMARELTLDAIPPAVVHQAKRLLLMGIAWSLIGTRNEAARGMAQVMMRVSGTGPCTVFGQAQSAGCSVAAFLNAAHAQVFDCNDGHTFRGAWHAGRVLIPTVCAAAEEAGASGTDLLESLVLGYEVAHRAQLNEGRSRSDGVGAAAAVGRMLRLPEKAWGHAIRLSDQHGPLLYPGPDNFNSDANHICNGMIARQAIEGAFLAAAGLTADAGPGRLLLDADLPQVQKPETFLIGQVYLKPHIACRLCHNAIDIVLDFRLKQGGRIGQIDRVEVSIAPDREFVKHRVKRDTHFKSSHFSLPYVVACALLDGEVGERQSLPERIAADDVQALQEKVIVEGRPRGPEEAPDSYPTTVRIKFKDGTGFTGERTQAKGSAGNPMTDDEVIALFDKWAGPGLGGDHKAKVVDRVMNLETVVEVRELTSLLRP